tara:strand:- start:161 stop:1087 length:927 start_codon:yes stop_codon:yes gene_type:complete
MIDKYQTKLYGYESLFYELVNIYNRKRLPNKILFSGKKGIGKSTFALHFINYIFSENEENKYILDSCSIDSNNKSYKLISQNIHPNFYYIKKQYDKKYIEISEIRNLNNFINKSSFNDHLKIVLIDDIEYLSTSASNSLLKIIEEPNNNVQFMLIQDSRKFVLDTIKSRCIKFNFNLEDKFKAEILNHYFQDISYENLSNEFKNNYLSISDTINIIQFCIEENFIIDQISIENLLIYIFKKNIFKLQKLNKINIKVLMEIYLHNIYKKNKSYELYKLINFYNKKYNDVIKYNLDLETYYLEVKDVFIK